MKKYWQGALLYVVIFVIIIGIMAFTGSGSGGGEVVTSEYTYNQLIEDLSGDDIKAIETQRQSDVDNYGTATVTFKDGTVAQVIIPSMSTFMDILHETGADENLRTTTEHRNIYVDTSFDNNDGYSYNHIHGNVQEYAGRRRRRQNDVLRQKQCESNG